MLYKLLYFRCNFFLKEFNIQDLDEFIFFLKDFEKVLSEEKIRLIEDVCVKVVDKYFFEECIDIMDKFWIVVMDVQYLKNYWIVNIENGCVYCNYCENLINMQEDKNYIKIGVIILILKCYFKNQ